MLTNCAPESLEEYLQSHVTALKNTNTDSGNNTTNSTSSSSPSPLKLSVLSDHIEYEFCNGQLDSQTRTFSPNQFRNEYLAQKNLILIFQDDQIVLGMTTFEYSFIPMVKDQKIKFWSRSYIQYLDSTGLYTPRSSQSYLTKSLVRAYLSFCSNVLHVKSVHLLATAKPSFLFAGSDLIETKRALSSVKLINWWISILQKSTPAEEEKGCNASSDRAKVFVYSPFEEAEGSSRLKKRISTIKNWSYGLPYDLRRPILDQIPLFEDDPKWRHFEATFLSNSQSESNLRLSKPKTKKARLTISIDDDDSASKMMSVKDFFESLQIRPEFRADPSAFFVIKFSDKFVDRCAGNNDGSICEKSDLATFGLKLLQSLTFESVSEATKSSQKLLSWMKLMKVNLSDVKEEIQPAKFTESIDIDKEKENCRPAVIQVQSLQSLIKKKKLN